MRREDFEQTKGMTLIYRNKAENTFAPDTKMMYSIDNKKIAVERIIIFR